MPASLRERMEALAERFQALSDEYSLQDRPNEPNADWFRALTTAYGLAAEELRAELEQSE